MNIKKSNIITAVLCTVALSVTSFYSGAAATASGIQYNSQGKIIFDNGTEDTTDDVVFDAADFLTIDSMVADGKKNIKDELNKYDGIDISEDIPTFDTLVASIDAISEGTDATAENILSGKKAVVGKSIVTGSMNDCSGRVISANKIVENGTNAEITISSGYYDEDSRISIPIETIIKDVPTINSNIGVHNKISLGTAREINIKEYTDKWASLTDDNFSVEVELAFKSASIGCNNPNTPSSASDQLLTDGAYDYSYNAKTGILTISVTNITWTMGFNGAFYYNQVNGQVTLTTNAYLFL